jgi:hypothetical protein
VRRGFPISVGSSGCIFCDAPSKSSVHLFLLCPAIFPLWYQVSRWLGWDFGITHGLAQQFQAFVGLGGGKRARLGFILIWHVVIWTVWTSWNDLMFSGGAHFVVDITKLLGWKWFLAKCPASSCTYHEWEVQRVLCWHR